jgi:signal transduction histidine kinase
MKKVLRLTESDLTKLIKRIVNENKNETREINRILDDIISSFEFSEKGNDEMITLAQYILDRPEDVANMIMSKLKKGFGAHDDGDSFGVYTSRRDNLSNLENKLGSKRR